MTEDRPPTAVLLEFLERFVWAEVPRNALGHSVTHDEEDQILGYGPTGV